jgi:murein DD-endopeptidase MepM/ murein hydrolase activator NlpD
MIWLILATFAIVSALTHRVRPAAPAAGRISSRYGSRVGRTSQQTEWHAGLDFSADGGPTVRAIWPGTIFYVGHDADRQAGYQGYGNCVVLRHVDLHMWSLYGHMASLAPGIARGVQVGAGTAIGAIGQTSNGRFATMPIHLHFEVRCDKPDGTSPFPGQYSQYNVNPEELLALMGLRYDSTGRHV